MTLIIGHETDDGFIIAADSATNRGDETRPSFNRKVGINGDLVIAGTGTQAVIDYVLNCMQFPPVDGDELKYLYGVLPMIQDGLKRLGLIGDSQTLIDAVNNDTVNFALIIGINNHVYEVDCYSTVSRLSGFTAHGTGAKYALGTLFGLYDNVHDTYQTFEAALPIAFRAACHYSNTVAPPFHVITKFSGMYKEAVLK